MKLTSGVYTIAGTPRPAFPRAHALPARLPRAGERVYRAITRPGSAQVILPASTTATPLTNT